MSHSKTSFISLKVCSKKHQVDHIYAVYSSINILPGFIYAHYLIISWSLVLDTSNEIITKENKATSGSKKRKKYKKNRKHKKKYKKNRLYNKNYKKNKLYVQEYNKKKATSRQSGEEFRAFGRPRCRSRRVARDQCQGLNNRCELFDFPFDN